MYRFILKYLVGLFFILNNVKYWLSVYLNIKKELPAKVQTVLCRKYIFEMV